MGPVKAIIGLNTPLLPIGVPPAGGSVRKLTKSVLASVLVLRSLFGRLVGIAGPRCFRCPRVSDSRSKEYDRRSARDRIH